MESLKIAVCEDDEEEYKKLSAILEESGTDVAVERFTDGSGLLEKYYSGRYDLLFIDIYIDSVNGIDTVAGIRKMDNDVPIAFLTTSLDHALDGYRYHVDRYITKPLRTGDIAEAIHKARLNKENAPSVNIPFGGKSKRVPLSRVRYLESQADSVYVYLTGGAFERTMLKLKDLAVMLPQPPFFVCHKSYIVNLQFVEGVDKKEGIFEMKEGGVACIRRESRSQAASVYRKYMFDLARGQNI